MPSITSAWQKEMGGQFPIQSSSFITLFAWYSNPGNKYLTHKNISVIENEANGLKSPGRINSNNSHISKISNKYADKTENNIIKIAIFNIFYGFHSAFLFLAFCV